ncbi:MAG: ATPase, partial [Pseudaminobacter sp.]|nr:ATPase [Pseudaminobacter sp.]
KIDPTTMPVYRLVNSAIDGVARDPLAVRADILRFASSDLVCYRAGAPEGLVEQQNKAWDSVLEWARDALGARLVLAEGVIYVEQPQAAIAVVAAHLDQRLAPLRLAAIHLMTSLTGSALLALAVEAGELDARAAWLAAHVDEDWQTDQWGRDTEAMVRRSLRERDMMSAACLLDALPD